MRDATLHKQRGIEAMSPLKEVQNVKGTGKKEQPKKNAKLAQQNELRGKYSAGT